jgi:hypothetical protein
VRWLPVGLAAGLFASAFPAVASATDYCVDATPACGPKNVASFEQALTQAGAASDPDRIFLGATTYTAPTGSGYGYTHTSSPVEIVGQGTGQTILTAPSGSENVLGLAGGAGSSIHDLTILLPQSMVPQSWGLITENTARHIEVIEHTTQANARSGVSLMNGGALEDSNVTLSSTSNTNAVRFGPGGGTVRRSTLNGWFGVLSDYGGTIERSRVTGSYVGLFADGNLTAVSGSLIRATGPTANVIFAASQPGSSTTVNADGVTIVGPGEPNTFGVGASDEPAPENVSVSLTNAIIRGVSTPLFAAGSGGGHQVKVAASYSDYDPSGNYTVGADGSITETNLSNVGDAGFVDAGGGDYHLLPSSPLVDAGDPASAQGLDLDGNPLVADGNGDGSIRRDMGAFELQPTGSGQQGGTTAVDTEAPLLSGFASTRKVFAVGSARTAISASAAHRTRFRYTLSEPAQVTITIQRALAGSRKGRYRTVGRLTRNGKQGSNSTPFSGRIGKRALRPGRYRAVARATDAAGNRSAPRRAGFRIAAR